ncbi:MAG TPA: phosphoribosylformylglycinamidine synthase subunit PurS [bacterium]|jgi:phosphoribosylformylglycinamidine synthase
MAIIRIIVTLKQGVLDAQGQAVQQGLRALGYAGASDVRVGRYIEFTVPDGYPPEGIRQMCDRLLANPLIEEWRLESPRPGPLPGGERERVRGRARSEARGPRPQARGLH